MATLPYPIRRWAARHPDWIVRSAQGYGLTLFEALGVELYPFDDRRATLQKIRLHDKEEAKACLELRRIIEKAGLEHKQGKGDRLNMLYRRILGDLQWSQRYGSGHATYYNLSDTSCTG